MGFIKKYKLELLSVLGIIVAYFPLRIFNIMSLPLFTDEAIYIRWSQIARYDANWRFISLTDGKQPSFVWLTMSVMRFVNDPLLAGRIVSVFAGFGTMVGLYLLGRKIFKNRWIGILSSLTYLIFPMALVYDRMALYDSLVGMFFVWSMFLSVLLVRKVRLDVALLLGMVLGGGMLTKSSLFFSIPLLFATYILFDFKQKTWKKYLLKLFGFSLIAVVIAFAMYSVLRLSPFYHIINDKNAIFAYPLNEWLQHPFTYFVSNLRGLFDWLIAYLTPLVLVGAVFAFLVPLKAEKRHIKDSMKIFTPFVAVVLILNILAFLGVLRAKTIEIQTLLPYVFFMLLTVCVWISYIKKYEFTLEKLLLVVWFGVPFIYLAFFGNTIYPRFIFFMTLSLMPLIAFSIYSLKNIFTNNLFFAGFLVIIFSVQIYSNFFIVTNFAVAPIPRSDYEQYINNWPAGGGTEEIISYLDKESRSGKIYIASLGTFGSLPTYAVEIYLGDNKNVDKRGIYPVPNEIPRDLQDKAKLMPTYLFVSNQQEFEAYIKTWPLTLIVQYPKGVLGKAYSRLYKVNPK